MMEHKLRLALAVGSIGVLAALTACSGGSSSGANNASKADPKAKVTITVGDEPKADQPADVANFLKRIKEFETQNPNITLKPSTEAWDAQTFQAKLAGGTLPTVMGASLTYSHELIANGKLPNMTPYLKDLGMLDDLNPLALKNVQDDKGQVYTVPTGLFSVGLAYNRSLFEKAGLDPNKPPTTWDEVRADAKTISDKVPGVAGYAQLTTNNTGGWMLTTMTYSMGGQIQNVAGTKSDLGPATTQALQLLQDMRWKDNSMGSQFLYDQTQLRQAFSAGKIGMALQAPDIYQQAVHNYGFDPKNFGETALPQSNGTNGTLTGGSLKLFNVKATPNELLAALKWVKYYDFEQYYNKDLATSNAQANLDSDNPVGLPTIPPVSDKIYQQYLGWIKPQIDVPLDQFTGYTDSKLKLIAEPPTATQQTYAALDPVVQKVLTDENANIKETLAAATQTLDGIITQAKR